MFVRSAFTFFNHHGWHWLQPAQTASRACPWLTTDSVIAVTAVDALRVAALRSARPRRSMRDARRHTAAVPRRAAWRAGSRPPPRARACRRKSPARRRAASAAGRASPAPRRLLQPRDVREEFDRLAVTDVVDAEWRAARGWPRVRVAGTGGHRTRDRVDHAYDALDDVVDVRKSRRIRPWLKTLIG